jgi:hypothetical protein
MGKKKGAAEDAAPKGKQAMRAKGPVRTPQTVFEQAAQNKTGEQFFVEAVIGHRRN